MKGREWVILFVIYVFVSTASVEAAKTSRAFCRHGVSLWASIKILTRYVLISAPVRLFNALSINVS